MRHVLWTHLPAPLAACESFSAYFLDNNASACAHSIYYFPVATARPSVAVIEADATDRLTLRSLLSSLDVDVHDFESAESYLASDAQALGCVITDVSLPGMSGMELLRLLRSMHISPPVILLGEESDVNAAVAAMREGAVDFIEKPHLDLAIVRRVAYLLDHSLMMLRH